MQPSSSPSSAHFEWLATLVTAARSSMGLFQSSASGGAYVPDELVEAKIALKDTVVVFSKSY